MFNVTVFTLALLGNCSQIAATECDHATPPTHLNSLSPQILGNISSYLPGEDIFKIKNLSGNLNLSSKMGTREFYEGVSGTIVFDCNNPEPIFDFLNSAREGVPIQIKLTGLSHDEASLDLLNRLFLLFRLKTNPNWPTQEMEIIDIQESTRKRIERIKTNNLFTGDILLSSQTTAIVWALTDLISIDSKWGCKQLIEFSESADLLDQMIAINTFFDLISGNNEWAKNTIITWLNTPQLRDTALKILAKLILDRNTWAIKLVIQVDPRIRFPQTADISSLLINMITNRNEEAKLLSLNLLKIYAESHDENEQKIASATLADLIIKNDQWTQGFFESYFINNGNIVTKVLANILANESRWGIDLVKRLYPNNGYQTNCTSANDLLADLLINGNEKSKELAVNIIKLCAKSKTEKEQELAVTVLTTLIEKNDQWAIDQLMIYTQDRDQQSFAIMLLTKLLNNKNKVAQYIVLKQAFSRIMAEQEFVVQLLFNLINANNDWAKNLVEECLNSKEQIVVTVLTNLILAENRWAKNLINEWDKRSNEARKETIIKIIANLIKAGNDWIKNQLISSTFPDNVTVEIMTYLIKEGNAWAECLVTNSHYKLKKQITTEILSNLILEDNQWAKSQAIDYAKNQVGYNLEIIIDTFFKLIKEDNAWIKDQLILSTFPDNVTVTIMTKLIKEDNAWAEDQLIANKLSDAISVKVIVNLIKLEIRKEWSIRQIIRKAQSETEKEQNIAMYVLLDLVESNSLRKIAANIFVELIRKNSKWAQDTLNEWAQDHNLLHHVTIIDFFINLIKEDIQWAKDFIVKLYQSTSYTTNYIATVIIEVLKNEKSQWAKDFSTQNNLPVQALTTTNNSKYNEDNIQIALKLLDSYNQIENSLASKILIDFILGDSLTAQRGLKEIYGNMYYNRANEIIPSIFVTLIERDNLWAKEYIGSHAIPGSTSHSIPDTLAKKGNKWAQDQLDTLNPKIDLEMPNALSTVSSSAYLALSRAGYF